MEMETEQNKITPFCVVALIAILGCGLAIGLALYNQPDIALVILACAVILVNLSTYWLKSTLWRFFVFCTGQWWSHTRCPPLTD